MHDVKVRLAGLTATDSTAKAGLMARESLIAGSRARNLVHLLFKNGVYHTSGAQEIPGGFTVDFVQMAKGAGYREAFAIKDIGDFRRRLPSILTAEGPLFVELITGLSEQTPMTVRGAGTPLHQQMETLRSRLAARA